MATVVTPHCTSQSASRCRSAVKVPKERTGSGSRSGPTAATCKVAPMSIAAAWGWTGAMPRRLPGRLARAMPCPPVGLSKEGLGRAKSQFPNRDRPVGVATLKPAAAHGPCFSSGSAATKKVNGRSPPRPSIGPLVSPATGGTAVREGFIGDERPATVEQPLGDGFDLLASPLGTGVLALWRTLPRQQLPHRAGAVRDLGNVGLEFLRKPRAPVERDLGGSAILYGKLSACQ